MLTGLEATTQYILKILRCQCWIVRSSDQCESWKKLPWTYACGSPQETEWRNIKTTGELSDEEEV